MFCNFLLFFFWSWQHTCHICDGFLHLVHGLLWHVLPDVLFMKMIYYICHNKSPWSLFQSLLPWKYLSADLTHKLTFFSIEISCVFCQTVFSLKRFSTLITFIWLFAWMCPLMLDLGRLPEKLIVTKYTSKVPTSFMQITHMTFQATIGFKYL